MARVFAHPRRVRGEGRPTPAKSGRRRGEGGQSTSEAEATGATDTAATRRGGHDDPRRELTREQGDARPSDGVTPVALGAPEEGGGRGARPPPGCPDGFRRASPTAAWGNFFVAEVGASAALVGLLFVAVSINLARILQHAALPGRAFEALVVLVMVLFVATFALVPGQSPTALGLEVSLVAITAWGITTRIQYKAPKNPEDPRSWMITRVFASQLALVPMIVGGVSLVVGAGGGLYWVVAASIASFLAALIDAWVLLVEIQR